MENDCSCSVSQTNVISITQPVLHYFFYFISDRKIDATFLIQFLKMVN